MTGSNAFLFHSCDVTSPLHKVEKLKNTPAHLMERQAENTLQGGKAERGAPDVLWMCHGATCTDTMAWLKDTALLTNKILVLC